jgi:branched-chain amino acid transport system permease protein
MDLSQVLSASQIANALALASLLTILASGLALIFGLRDVMNFGHGSLFMLGAYLSYSLGGLMNFWAALVIVPVLLGAIGVAFEYLAIRPLQKRTHMEIALVTFGLSLIITQLIVKGWGPTALSISSPPVLSGSIDLFGKPYPVYRVFLIFMGFGTCLALGYWLKYTKSGMHVRAASQQPIVARMMGVNTDRLSLLVVCLGTSFAGLAGVLAGPYLSVDPNLGASILISCLIVVVIGGLGSIGGAIAASVLYGFIHVMGSIHSPTLAVLAPFIMLFVVLLWRPQGFGSGRVT